MRFILSILISILFTSLSFSQHEINTDTFANSKYHKSISLELLGAHIGSGINFDMRLQKGRNDGLGFRAGIGGYDFNSSILFSYSSIRDLSILNIPLEANYVVGKKRHGFVGGIGILPSIITVTGDDPRRNDDTPFTGNAAQLIGSYALVGYRFSPLRTGFTVQIHYNPLFIKDIGKVEYFGIQLGMGFK